MSAADLSHPAGGPDPERLTPDETENAVFGFWLFLMSDAVVFALLFATYGVMVGSTAGGPTPASVFKLLPAFVETVLLLTSSVAYGRASVALQFGESRRALCAWLLLTLALGLAFLAFELNDFRDMAAQGAVPARSGFLSAFFALVPLHGLHVAVGCLWLIVMVGQVATIGLDDRVRVNLKRLGLFWHFLDVIWIAIFSVVYLAGHLQ